MAQALERFLFEYGAGFFVFFWIPAGIISAILVFEAGASIWREARRRLVRDERGAEDELGETRPGFAVSPPETTLRQLHYRPLERFLMQPFSRHVNRVKQQL